MYACIGYTCDDGMELASFVGGFEYRRNIPGIFLKRRRRLMDATSDVNKSCHHAVLRDGINLQIGIRNCQVDRDICFHKFLNFQLSSVELFSIATCASSRFELLTSVISFR